MKRFIAVLMVIAISLTLLVLSIETGAYNEDFFISKYKKHDIVNITGKSMKELEPITEKLILYIKGGENDLLMPHFNEGEILHMEDVRDLFDLARVIKYIGIFIIVAGGFYFWKKKESVFLAKKVFYGLFANHILLALLEVLVYKDFNKYFTYFHKIFFTNDLWILDPSTDLMIQMLPEEFFSGMAITIMITFLVSLTVLQVLSYLYMRKNRIKNAKVITR